MAVGFPPQSSSQHRVPTGNNWVLIGAGTSTLATLSYNVTYRIPCFDPRRLRTPVGEYALSNCQGASLAQAAKMPEVLTVSQMPVPYNVCPEMTRHY